MKIPAVLCLAAVMALASCTDLIFDDRSGCDRGVFVDFRYDYNLQRADMFADHVGEVTLYVFDEAGRLVTRRSEANDESHAPLKDKDYAMYLDLPDGRYRFVALAQQRSYGADDESRARFVRTEPAAGEPMEKLSVALEHRMEEDGAYIDHRGLPLDTLWHAVSDAPVEIVQGRYVHQTLSLVRNTKYISVSLRDIDRPEGMDIDDYELRIAGANVGLRHDNSEDAGLKALCTPYVTWNTRDSDAGGRTSATGATGHADFMTSRIFAHENPADDEVLVVRHKETGRTVIEVNLPELLGQLRNHDELHRYPVQEFLDRGCDYDLTFFLSGGSWVYANVSIGVLGWNKRVQNVEL